MASFRELYDADMTRYGREGADPYSRRLLRSFRRIQTSKSKCVRFINLLIYWLTCKSHGNEIHWLTKIGKGMYLGHPYNITINPDAVIGKNFNIHKGAVIGRTNRGAKKGVPTLGDCVWVGINAVVVGGITIGDDVLIAPNAYVNCDVPSHSIVLGNPCVIRPRENATEFYIENKA